MEDKYNPFTKPREEELGTEAHPGEELEEAKKEAGVVTWHEHLDRLIETEDPKLIDYAKEEIRLKSPDNSPRTYLPLKSIPPGIKLKPQYLNIIKALQNYLKQNSRLPADKYLEKTLPIPLGTLKGELVKLKHQVGVSSKLDLAFLDLEEYKNLNSTEKDFEKLDTPRAESSLGVRLISIPNGIKLTPREKVVIKQIHDGVVQNTKLSPKELAYRLNIEHDSYKVYISHVLTKLGLESALQLAFLDLDSERK